MLSRVIFVILFLSFFHPAFGQEISGIVYAKDTEEPIVGASVYYDGSSLGTITDKEGAFNIDSFGHTNAILIVSHIGYKTKRIEPPFTPEKLQVFLEVEVETLKEVVVVTSPFSRKQMLNIFRWEFLGRSRSARKCKILNEDDIWFYYDHANRKLSAYSESSVIVENEHLAYQIRFDLQEFEISFKSNTLKRLDNINYTLISGFTHFTGFGDNSKILVKRRERAFFGSPMHFMRTCWNNSFEKERIIVKTNERKISSEEFFETLETDENMVKKIRFLDKKFTLIFKLKNKYQSTLEILEDATYAIDERGNYRPYDKLLFGGYMADLRIGDMVPFDYISKPK